MRPSWSEYFLEMAALVAKRSTCLRRQVGAVAVKDGRIIATGYNGAPVDFKHCQETGCLREQQGVPSGQRHELCRAVHAEQNMIIQAATHGVSISGAYVYCTTTPCIICAKMLINCKINSFIYPAKEDLYPDDMAMKMLFGSRICTVAVADRE